MEKCARFWGFIFFGFPFWECERAAGPVDRSKVAILKVAMLSGAEVVLLLEAAS